VLLVHLVDNADPKEAHEFGERLRVSLTVALNERSDLWMSFKVGDAFVYDLDREPQTFVLSGHLSITSHQTKTVGQDLPAGSPSHTVAQGKESPPHFRRQQDRQVAFHTQAARLSTRRSNMLPVCGGCSTPLAESNSVTTSLALSRGRSSDRRPP
jgi:hypothetical protein